MDPKPTQSLAETHSSTNELLTQLVEGIQLTGDVRSDVTTFLTHHDHSKTLDHCMRVAAKAKRLAAQFGADELEAQTAGWLHDISTVFPAEQRTQIARQLGLDVLAEEAAAPMIVHQRLSAVMAREIFGVTNEAVLSAIECHSTLKANASVLDKVVFIADKIEWDQPGGSPYLKEVLAALEQSLDQAVLCYLHYLWQRRDTLPVVHPWFVDAYEQLSGALEK
jgi:predicted HD superfamily hydrolase involved in NAD metabolism